MFNIGKHIKQIRKSKRMTQTEFGEVIGISQNYLSEIEKGICTPSLKTLSKIADRLNISISKFLE